MNKKIIAAAIAASFVAPAVMADVTVYGKVRQSVDMVDVTGGDDEWQINDRGSRLGFKGSEDLGNGLKAIYKMEFNVFASRGGSTGKTNGGAAGGHVNDTDTITANRNQYVGLAGDFGTVLIGRHDAPSNMAWSKNNPFNDTAADLKTGSWTGNNTAPIDWERIDGTIAYVSPSFSGLTAAVAIVPDETTYNATGGDGLADHWSGALMYSNGPLYVGLGYLDLDTPALGDQNEWNLTAMYSMDAFKVGVTYEDAEEGNNNDTETWIATGTYTMGNNVLKAQWWDKDSDTAGDDRDGWAVGLDHNFSKRTQAQLTYASSDTNANYKDTDVFSIGLNHNF